MNKLSRYTPTILLVAGLFTVTLYLRANATAFVPVPESLTFAFQLMLAGTALAILRNEGGISTFGVFGPVILAFGWLEIGPFWGFLFIAYVFVVTTATRAAMSGLDLGTAHRVATLLIVASIAVYVLQIVGSVEGAPPFSAVLVFPIILTTWYAERFVQNVAETGWAPASRRLLFTLVGISVAYLVAGYEPLVSAVIRTPETWVLLVTINIGLGVSTNRRFGEALRFRMLRRALGSESPTEILTMRVRNREFINRYNPPALMAAFSKVRMKEFLHGLDIPSPETYLIVESDEDIPALRTLLTERDRFAIKPVTGSGGREILVVRGRDEETGDYFTNRGSLTEDEIISHTRNICVGGLADYGARSSALVEALVTPSGLLADRVTTGVPDLRVIVLRGFPIMAMVRLPTRESNETANIHTGAVAVAVDIASGEAAGGYQQTRNRFLDEHPDTGTSLSFAIPEWESVLSMAAEAAIASGFGYTGVDIVFDAYEGPMVLEVNRRPGLGIQNANMAGLLGRLRFVESQSRATQCDTAKERVRRAIEWSENDWKPTDSAEDAPPALDMEVNL